MPIRNRTPDSSGYKNTRAHFVIDVKHNRKNKAVSAAGGHLTPNRHTR